MLQSIRRRYRNARLEHERHRSSPAAVGLQDRTHVLAVGPGIEHGHPHCKSLSRNGCGRPRQHLSYNRIPPMKVSVILPAAGLGTRMGRSSPEKAGVSRKQFMLLDGLPILVHTIRKFVATPLVSEIIVALRAEDIEW